MCSKNKNVVAVILFGSLAKKQAIPGSDADVLILLKNSKKRFEERIPDFIPEKIGIGVDVFPYTIDEFVSLINENWSIAKEALKNGILLYAIENFNLELF